MPSTSCSSWAKHMKMAAALLLISGANGLNSCLDPTSDNYACVAGMTEISFFEFGGPCESLVNDDMPDLNACFDAIGRSGLTHVEIISNDELTSLPEDLFEGMDNLTELWIVYNEMLHTLPEGLFKDNTALTTLNLLQNYLVALPVGIFEGLTNLVTLPLQFNNFTTLPAGVFAPMTSLEELWLHGYYMKGMQCLPASTAGNIRLSLESISEGTCGCTPEYAVSCPEGTTCSPGTEGYTCDGDQSPTPVPSVSTSGPVAATTVDESTCTNGLPGYDG
ncbi:unnamed protein product, partial [Pylaiella littoralis]